ncbi:OLC1v1036561C1 [Oldenlandia corymbosa var. corymbosa]|uniref:OLC1v1036561C1 n=1 Tax=Oldenlandia corymbosa var. corymbosa TaxID=529605 RepID=A0AAV1CVL4_OLDCO|nr:OLC1v1036561C1 [Oldenlandia corymbosa var. corymbosa]
MGFKFFLLYVFYWIQLAGIYKNVVATDTSPTQLEYAVKLPNIIYQCTPPIMSISEVNQLVSSESNVDLVSIASAMHWFDLPTFYQQVKFVLKKPDGVIAAYSYRFPEINEKVDEMFHKMLTVDVAPFMAPQANLIVRDKYTTIDFPFEAVDGLDHTGPFEFESKKMMNLEGYFTFVRSWSAYQTAKDKGVELLSEDLVEDFTRAWKEDGKTENVATFPIHLRIGKVGRI